MYQTYIFESNALTSASFNVPLTVNVTLDSLYQMQPNKKIMLNSLNIVARMSDAGIWKLGYAAAVLLKGLPGITQNLNMEDDGGWAEDVDSKLDGLLLGSNGSQIELPFPVQIESAFTVDMYMVISNTTVVAGDRVQIFMGMSYELFDV